MSEKVKQIGVIVGFANEEYVMSLIKDIPGVKSVEEYSDSAYDLLVKVGSSVDIDTLLKAISAIDDYLQAYEINVNQE